MDWNSQFLQKNNFDTKTFFLHNWALLSQNLHLITFFFLKGWIESEKTKMNMVSDISGGFKFHTKNLL
jgi:hypothetical protein